MCTVVLPMATLQYYTSLDISRGITAFLFTNTPAGTYDTLTASKTIHGGAHQARDSFEGCSHKEGPSSVPEVLTRPS